MYRFESGEQLDQMLLELIERELVAPLPRRPGERGQRYTHLLASGEEEPEAAPAAEPVSEPPAAGHDDGLGERVGRLEAELEAVRAELRALREELGA
jgi:uncharacterized protein